MHRTQLIIEDWQYEYLRDLSDEKGKSISEIVREMISSFIEEEISGSALSDICGIGEDEEGSGKDHNKLLYNKVDDD
ncbi:MAG: hypothetical protein SCARUB_03631 [Candidatus Scalindua rubra]|uniref:Ribbon-helix-helix protein CopG domain-containing protein n=1 Tax=Candidatus Scalindua rubra TaxID=1872076 RepID=A0A1E3X6I1_9BACT|nr:MAG: hypothetical protein SCARUB_03631 [Candidatus Scalindua rubra]